jgi:hypothetical protein
MKNYIHRLKYLQIEAPITIEEVIDDAKLRVAYSEGIRGGLSDVPELQE